MEVSRRGIQGRAAHVEMPTKPPGLRVEKSLGRTSGMTKTAKVQKACVYVWEGRSRVWIWLDVVLERDW